MVKRLPQEESKLWQRLKSTAPKELALDRFEARSPTGVSDVFWTRQHPESHPHDLPQPPLCGWIELKSNAPDIRPGQRIWLNRLTKHHQSAWILAEYGSFVYLYHPSMIQLDCKIPYRDDTRPPAARIPRGAAADEWADLWQRILHPA